MRRIGKALVAASVVAVLGAAVPSAAVGQEADAVVRVVARRLGDGRVEFGLQQRGSGSDWGERLLPSRRYFPADAAEGRWLSSSALRVSGLPADAVVRVVARRLGDGRVEFGLQQRGSGSDWGERLLPSRRYFPADAAEGRWLSSSALRLQARGDSAGEAPRRGDAPIAAERGAALIAAGGYHTCAVNADGGVDCWGDNSASLRLGDPSLHRALVPVPVQGLDDVVAISVGDSAAGSADGPTCVLHSDRTVSCWGDNYFGGIGDGTWTDRPSPVRVRDVNDAVDVSVGARHACAVHADGGASCWGDNEVGQLGDGTGESRPRAARVSGLGDVTSIGAGAWHTCAVHADGAVSCWGNNDHRELGDGTSTERLAPVRVRGLEDAASVSAGHSFSCAVRRSGAVSCWGSNYAAFYEAGDTVFVFGTLGAGKRDSTLSRPTPVVGITDAVAIATGAWSSCALHRDGDVSCWGANPAGEVGIGTTEHRREPRRLRGVSDVVALTVSSQNPYQRSHACVLTVTSEVACWGDNRYGQLGVGDTEARLEPTRVAPAATDDDPRTVIPAIGVPDWNDEDAQVDAGPFRAAMDELVAANEAAFPWLRIAWNHARDDVRVFDLADGGTATVSCGFTAPGEYGCDTSSMAIGTGLGERSMQELLHVGVHELAHVYDQATALTPNRPWGATQMYFAVNYPDCLAGGEEAIADAMLHLVLPDAPLTYYGSASACLGTPPTPAEEDLEVLRSGLAGEVPAWYTRTFTDGAAFWWTFRGLPTNLSLLANLMGEFGGLCRTDFLMNWTLVPQRRSNPFRDGGC